MLHFLIDKIEIRLNEILSHHQRIKRDLINGVDSIFKAMIGNLDVNEGEYNEKITEQLQLNQNKLKKKTRLKPKVH